MGPAAVSCSELALALREVGLNDGDSLIVHSSLRSLGHVEGGADTVIDALLDTIGPDGNLMLPTFNYTRLRPEPYYDPAETPCRTGAVPEAGRKRPGAVRSLHPTHSVAVIGPRAEELTRDHLSFRALGIGSPIDRLVQAGGKVLLIGVGHTANSTIHLAEEYADLPKASSYDPLPELKIRTPDGRLITHRLDTSCSCSFAFGGAEYPLRLHGEIHDFRLGGCKIQLVLGSDVVRRVRALIADRADVLLCTRSGCRPCIGARQVLRAQGRI